MKIYLQDLEKYNNGCSVCGEWIDLKEMEDDELKEKMKKIVQDEFVILDWEYENEEEEVLFKDIMHKYACPFSLLERQQIIQELDDDEKRIIYALILNSETFETALFLKDEVEVIDLSDEISPFGKSEVALADYFIENGLIKVSDCIKPYIDYERLGKDLVLDYSEPITGLFLRY